MTFGIAQWFFIIFFSCNVGLSLVKDGQPTHINLFYSYPILVAQFMVLIYANFFRVIHWPQITTVVLMILSLIMVTVEHGKPTVYKFPGTVFGTGIYAYILFAGGFFG
jgi:uncharacterized membrane protein